MIRPVAAQSYPLIVLRSYCYRRRNSFQWSAISSSATPSLVRPICSAPSASLAQINAIETSNACTLSLLAVSARVRQCASLLSVLAYNGKAVHAPRCDAAGRASSCRDTCRSRKFNPAGIRAVKQNQRIIQCDVCDHLPACNLDSLRSVQVTTPA